MDDIRTKRISTRKGAGSPTTPLPGVSTDVRTKVPPSIQNLLWGRAAGRCEFVSCNRPLWKSDVTQETRNIAQKAHIRAFSLRGPRAEEGWLGPAIHSLDNLILLCPICHLTIDSMEGPTRYTAEMLDAMKREHEGRVDVATGVAPNLASRVLTYSTYIGGQQALPTQKEIEAALFPLRFPAPQGRITLGSPTGPWRDVDAEFWRLERAQLSGQFGRLVRPPIEQCEIQHLSVFALAPQPLLIELGVLLGDITEVDVYQRHREPQTWCWPVDGTVNDFEVVEPPCSDGIPALVFSVSGTITPDRIYRVLGPQVDIWTVRIQTPNNDSLKHRATSRAFRATVRALLDRIKAAHGHRNPLHIFPALPVALAVEFGRLRMPKADMPWTVYDENQQLGGFAHSLTIGQAEGSA